MAQSGLAVKVVAHFLWRLVHHAQLAAVALNLPLSAAELHFTAVALEQLRHDEHAGFDGHRLCDNGDAKIAQVVEDMLYNN